MEYRQHLSVLKANAARCRELAGSASDVDVREALLELARDIEAAMPILEQDAQQAGGTQTLL